MKSQRVPGRAIVLGTVQFGLDYGIANPGGAPDTAEAARILSSARAAGIDTLDTAIAYGDAEARLGELGIAGFAAISKLPALPDDCADVGAWVESQVQGSLRRLRVTRLAALCLHRPAQALGPRGPELIAALHAQRDAGRVERLGLSVYSPEELPALLAAGDFRLVQAPGNPFDRRFRDGGWAQRLHERGCALHLRSCFLQGLLLLPAQARPPWCARWPAPFMRWDAFLRSSGLSALEACLRFALGAGADRLVLGVDSAAQLEAILAMPGEALELPPELACDDPDLVNPSRWPPTKK